MLAGERAAAAALVKLRVQASAAPHTPSSNDGSRNVLSAHRPEPAWAPGSGHALTGEAPFAGVGAKLAADAEPPHLSHSPREKRRGLAAAVAPATAGAALMAWLAAALAPPVLPALGSSAGDGAGPAAFGGVCM